MSPDEEAAVITLDEPDDLSQPVVVKLDDEAASKPAKQLTLAQTAAQKVKDRDAEIAAAKAEALKQTQRADHEARRAMAADNRASQIETASRNTNVMALTSAIEARKTERASLRKAYSDALSAGDHDKAAEINDKIADLAADQKTLEGAKFEAERAAKQAPQVQRELPVDPVERFIVQTGTGGTASADWLRAHPQAVEDEDKLRYAAAKALKSHANHSPGFFAEVEKIMGFGEDDNAAPVARTVVERETPAQRRAPAAPPSASADRSIGRTANGGYIMTPEMREAARNSGVTDKEYLRAFLKINENRDAYGAEGKFTFSSVDR